MARLDSVSKLEELLGLLGTTSSGSSASDTASFNSDFTTRQEEDGKYYGSDDVSVDVGTIFPDVTAHGSNKRRFFPIVVLERERLQDEQKIQEHRLDLLQEAPVVKRRKSDCQKNNYRGVSWHKYDKKWTARAWVRDPTRDGKPRTIYLGTFKDMIVAAIAVDEKILASVNGDESCTTQLNFPGRESRYQILAERLIGNERDTKRFRKCFPYHPIFQRLGDSHILS